MKRLLATTIALFVCPLAIAQQEAPATNPPATPEQKSADTNPMMPRVQLKTTLGDITIELNGEKAPISALNFIDYAKADFYDGTIFHRVIPTFMIQGGGHLPNLDQKREGLRPPIKNEWENGLKNEVGTIAMARLGRQPDSATAQFFINVKDNNALDMPRDGAGYAVFGKVVEGMNVVDKIKNTPVGTHPKYAGGQRSVVPKESVVIEDVVIVSEFDRAAIEKLVEKAAERERAAEEARKKAEEELKKEEKKRADEFAKIKGGATTTDTGLAYKDTVVGDGAQPDKEDTVLVHYTGYLMNGHKFDSSYDRNAPWRMNLARGAIAGFREAVSTMKVGGKRIAFLPPEIAYGERGRPPIIPPNSTLVFEVELVEVLVAMSKGKPADVKPEPTEKKAEEKKPGKEEADKTEAVQDKPAERIKANEKQNPQVLMKTRLGEFVIELDINNAPISTENFLRYVDEGYYVGTIIHFIKNTSTMKKIQLGTVTPEMQKKTEGLHSPIKSEWPTGLNSVRGAVGYVRDGRRINTAQAEFFINGAPLEQEDNPNMWGGAGFTIFGNVVRGMDTVDKILGTEVTRHPKYPRGGTVVPVEPIVILEAKRIKAVQPSAESNS